MLIKLNTWYDYQDRDEPFPFDLGACQQKWKETYICLWDGGSADGMEATEWLLMLGKIIYSALAIEYAAGFGYATDHENLRSYILSQCIRYNADYHDEDDNIDNADMYDQKIIGDLVEPVLLEHGEMFTDHLFALFEQEKLFIVQHTMQNKLFVETPDGITPVNFDLQHTNALKPLGHAFIYQTGVKGIIDKAAI